ncbi:pleckstrin domain-containing protein [Cavenderia fasciculata]|uniref:Pleckstrin domain-containing protein n=1 Tax=Cavenderia fasciculata TaxID=261658 RepID=F4PW26_CACFS|nr:pleckstrin domain-containing protein [Cavenderia fasciculata]EGG20190.1 pleckstrin domain-containing protein [Cavenderia fasciculata]|eukprot:XP_004367173.1 pleckstrin domain-containing protein [Cavenderia fasciculata]
MDTYVEDFTMQVISIRDTLRSRKLGAKSKKVFDLMVTTNGKSFTLEITQKKLNKLMSEIKKELYNVQLPNITINSGATDELIALFHMISNNPKMARSNALLKFVEKHGNKALSKAFVTEEFLKDSNFSGVLLKFKNKHKVTKKERLCFIKYNRMLYYYTMSKEVKGSICLDDCVVQKESTPGSFLLQTPTSGKYLFVAQSAANADQWMAALKDAISFCAKSKLCVSGQLSCTIVKGRSLTAKDLTGTSDPFAIAKIEGQQSKTQTIYKTLNPSWNESFVFYISKNQGYFYILVWDEDKYSASDFIGKAVIPLSALPQGQDSLLYLPMTPKTSKNSVKGDICVRLKYSYSMDNPPQGAQSPIFGQALTTFENRPDISKDSVPTFIYECVTFFEKHGAREEGIFRICGSSLEIKSLKQQIDMGQTISYTPDAVHSIAGVFKLYFRELPEPILTFDKYESFMTLGSSMNIKQATTLVKSLPKGNQTLLFILLPFLNFMGKAENGNMMNYANLAIVFGPAFLRPLVETNDSILKINIVNEITRKLIELSPQLFVV